MSAIQYLKQARQLYQTDSRAETMVAALIVLVVFAPGLMKLWRFRKRGMQDDG